MQDLTAIADLYTQNLKDFGPSPNSVGWRDAQTHTLRFEKLCYVIKAALHQGGDTPYTVADLGCGYGAMYTYLKENPRGQMTRFTGLDISAEMLTAAQSLYPNPDVEFLSGNRLTAPCDFAFASGIFNVRFETPEAEWTDYVHEVLDNLNQYSTRGFAFNVLTSYVDYRENHLYYANPNEYFDYCKTRFSKKVTLLHDYPLYEWTLAVLK